MEPTSLDELLRERIDFKQVHQAESEGLTRQLWSLLIFLLDEIVNEVSSLCRGFFDSCKRDELGKGVCSHVAFRALFDAGMLLEEAIENFYAVKFFIGVVALLNLVKETDAHSAVLDDAIDQSKRPADQICITTD